MVLCGLSLIDTSDLISFYQKVAVYLNHSHAQLQVQLETLNTRDEKRIMYLSAHKSLRPF